MHTYIRLVALPLRIERERERKTTQQTNQQFATWLQSNGRQQQQQHNKREHNSRMKPNKNSKNSLA